MTHQSVYVKLIVGPERFTRDRWVRELTGTDTPDKFTAGEVDMARVIETCHTISMWSPRRVVIVRSLERWNEDPALDRLYEYAQHPVDSTCLVLVAEKLDGRRKLMALAKKTGFLVSCPHLDDRELPRWIFQRAQEKGNTIDLEVCKHIAQIAGPSLATIDDTVERLSLFVGKGGVIDAEAVAQCVTRVRLADTWKLVDAVGSKNLGQSLTFLADAYDPRDRGLPLLGALAWSVRQRRPRDLPRWLLGLQQTDLALKSSRRPADSILEEMICRLVRR